MIRRKLPMVQPPIDNPVAMIEWTMRNNVLINASLENIYVELDTIKKDIEYILTQIPPRP